MLNFYSCSSFRTVRNIMHIMFAQTETAVRFWSCKIVTDSIKTNIWTSTCSFYCSMSSRQTLCTWTVDGQSSTSDLKIIWGFQRLSFTEWTNQCFPLDTEMTHSSTSAFYRIMWLPLSVMSLLQDLDMNEAAKTQKHSSSIISVCTTQDLDETQCSALYKNFLLTDKRGAEREGG